MNIGFKTGTKFLTDKVITDVKTYEGVAVKVFLSDDSSFVCGAKQLLKTADGIWVEAENSLDCYLTDYLQVTDVMDIYNSVELFDITVDSEEHEFFILVGDNKITVHNGLFGHGGWLEKVFGGGGGGSSTPAVSNSTVTVVKDTTIYIPETIIQFSSSRMKPNTTLYVFFDGKALPSDCVKPYGRNWGETLITDSSGYVSGDIKIPNNSNMKFVEGQREILLTDSPTNSDSTTSARAVYTYTGTTETPDNPSLDSSTPVNDYSIDPIIQSFYCNERGGMYLSKVGLYFANKDNSQPIILQIREVKDNRVSSSYLAGTNITIEAKDVNVSQDPISGLATWVEFSNPIFLTEGKEYALFMVTNSTNYILHTVEYGKQTNNITATKDISTGSFIKYRGANTWIKDDSMGIKFSIQKCKFDTANTYNLTVSNVANGDKLLKRNSLYVDKDNEKIVVTDPNHSFNVGSFVTISGLPDRTYGNIPSNVINGVHRITGVTWDGYSFDNYYEGSTEKEIDFSGAINFIISDAATTDDDIQYDNLVWNPNYLLLTGTSIQYNYKGLSGQSLDGNEQPYSMDSTTSYIEPKSIFVCSEVKKIASPLNSNKFSVTNGKSIQITASLKTNNENVSPMIDKHNLNAIAIENLINNSTDDETDANDGKACARKIFKTVQLYEQATGLKVNFKASVQAGSDIKVYYKTLNVGESGSIDSKPWIQMNLKNEVTKSLNANDFQEYDYMVDEIEPFGSFKTKIVMTSNNSTKVPLVSKYAAIAFAK